MGILHRMVEKMLISSKSGKHCLKELGKLCPPELRGNPGEVYNWLKNTDLTEEQKLMMNKIWLDYHAEVAHGDNYQ